MSKIKLLLDVIEDIVYFVQHRKNGLWSNVHDTFENIELYKLSK